MQRSRYLVREQYEHFPYPPRDPADELTRLVRTVLEPLGKWKKRGEPGHVILGGVDGDSTAARLMQEGYVDATGVQDLFFEAHAIMDALLEAIESGAKTPEKWIDDPGFALTQANLAERAMDMWGYRLFMEKMNQGSP